MAELSLTGSLLLENNSDIHEAHISRPSNAWILFRTAFHRTNSLQDISRGASEEWKAMKNRGLGEQDVWKQLAKEEKLAHEKKYPHYKFRPVINGKNVGGKTTQKGKEGVEGAKPNTVANQPQGAFLRKAARRRPAASGPIMLNTQEADPSPWSMVESGMPAQQGCLNGQVAQECVSIELPQLPMMPELEMLLKASAISANGPDSVATYDAHEWDQHVEAIMGELPTPSSSGGISQSAQYEPDEDGDYDAYRAGSNALQYQATYATAGYYQYFYRYGGTWGPFTA